MNEDILKGTWMEIKGRIKEKWARLTDNDFGEIEGKGEKLLGILQKKHGYMRNKAKLEYRDTVELAQIVSSIREIMTNNKDTVAIAFIARYGRPLFANKNQERQIERKEQKQRDDTDRYFDSRLGRRNTHLALR